MKTILYITDYGFNKSCSNEFYNALKDVAIDETIIWEGDNSILRHDISTLPCLIVDEDNVDLYETPEEEANKKLRIKKRQCFEHRNNEDEIAKQYVQKLIEL